ncbi:GerW family sporulation protein [Bacillus sp. AFS053548]|uniref:GerW family sporulation protein n=1 Tax=Bacillus sp. AFS053548 TaxID=2033505 RepID=UPI000BFB509D|nr:GerW family sporulation protein [Bacillus sp. AFS053548]PGM49571.1 sporulation protein YtfJ [Bacillus sp. AFS053548]
MSQHPIGDLMHAAMENLSAMINVNTIIGDPISTPDGSLILTVSKVGVGFAAGGSEFRNYHLVDGVKEAEVRSPHPFGGGTGGGASITPIAFLIVGKDGVKLLHLDQNTHLIEKLMDLAPQALEKAKKYMKKKDNSVDDEAIFDTDLD